MHDTKPAKREPGPVVGRAACGNHAVMPGTLLPPVILPTAHRLPSLVAVRRALRLDTVLHGRLADPPDTPPPIAAA